MLKHDPQLFELLDAAPELPSERCTKDELLEWCTTTHELLVKVRRVLLNAAANGLLIIGEPQDEQST